MAGIDANPGDIEQGGRVQLTATAKGRQTSIVQAIWWLPGEPPLVEIFNPPAQSAATQWSVPDDLQPGVYGVGVELTPSGGGAPEKTEYEVRVRARPFASGDEVSVTLRRTGSEATDDQALWVAIRNNAAGLSFPAYRGFVDRLLCGTASRRDERRFDRLERRRALPFPDMDPYRVLKVATEVFMMANCGVRVDADRLRAPFRGVDLAEERTRLGVPDLDDDPFKAQILDQWSRYIGGDEANRIPGEEDEAYLPYLAVIRLKLGDIDVVGDRKFGVSCYGILRNKLTNPCLIELLWSYWHREAHLVHVVRALLQRFQNVRAGYDRDPLAHLEIDPLRPLGSLLWGMVNDEQHQLPDARVTYELIHHYGIALLGDRVPELRPADSRVHFLEAFHNLLHVVTVYLKEDDDTTVLADAFPVLNALKEVHLQLTEGQANQYLELPWQARQEDLMREYLLARPEIREFLPGRTMVAYPEPWMDAVESVKRLYGWNGPSVMHFRDLGVFGEQLLLGIRYGNWNSVVLPQQAANWVRYWRPELQGYIHAYRAVTGVDLASEPVNTTMPAVLLRRRLGEQMAAHGVRPPVQAPGRTAPIGRAPGAYPRVTAAPTYADGF